MVISPCTALLSRGIGDETCNDGQWPKDPSRIAGFTYHFVNDALVWFPARFCDLESGYLGANVDGSPAGCCTRTIGL